MPGNIIDSFWIALGIKPDLKGLNEVKGQVEGVKSSLLGLGSALTAAVSGLALKKVADIGSQFEQNRIQIAGFLSALSEGKTSYTEGLQEASGVIQQITNDAAKLPGEAEEYIEVFKAGLPFVQGAMPGGSLQDFTNFTNKLTAIGKTFGLDAGIISREFDHMLSPGKGMASLRLPLFRQLLPFMKQVQGQAGLTAESFNAMTAPQRLQLLQSTFEKLQPMLDASADSFDAMEGALVSTGKQLVRMGSAGLFQGLKNALGQVNALFFDADGNITETGKDVVSVFAELGEAVGSLVESGVELVKFFARDDDAARTLKDTLKVAAMVIGGLGLAVVLVAQDLWGFYNGADSVTGVLVDKWGPAIYGVIAALAALAFAFSPVLAAIGLTVLAAYELRKHWQDVLDFVQGGLNGWVNVINLVIDGLNKVIGLVGGTKLGHIGGFSFADENRQNEWAQNMLGAGAGVLAPAEGPRAPLSMTGADLFGGPRSVGPLANGPVTTSETNISGGVHFHGAEDPQKMGRDWERVRNGQTKGAL